jgi:hypothetical protein
MQTLGRQGMQCVVITGLFTIDYSKVERELQRTMMEESNKMITHSAQSLGLAAGELKDLVVRYTFK